MAVMPSMAVPALVADNTQSDSLLTYQVADGLNLNDTTAFADFYDSVAVCRQNQQSC